MNYQDIAMEFEEEFAKALEDFNKYVDYNQEQFNGEFDGDSGDVFWYEAHQQLLNGLDEKTLFSCTSLSIVGLGSSSIVARSTKYPGLVYAYFADDPMCDSRITDFVEYKCVGPDLYHLLEGNPIQGNIVKIYYHSSSGVLMEELVGYRTLASLEGQEYFEAKLAFVKFNYNLIRMGYIHQDFHGENVLVDKSGNLKMIDLATVININFNDLVETLSVLSDGEIIELANLLYLGNNGYIDDEVNSRIVTKINLNCPILDKYKEVKVKVIKP